MHRGEIWWVNLDPTIGSEIKKKRPAVIISSDSIGILPLKVIVPITEWKEHFAGAPWLVKIPADRNNQLIKDSTADALQVRSVSIERLDKRLGVVNEKTLGLIVQAVHLVIGDV